MKKVVFSLIFCLLSFYASAQTGYDIKINLKNSKDTLAYLTFYQMDKNMVKDTCTHIKNGRIVFKGKGKLDKGVYSIISQDKRILFDFYIDDTTQNLTLKSDATADYYSDLEAIDSKAENDFFNYVRYVSSQNAKLESALKEAKGKSKKDSLAIVKNKRSELDKDVHSFEENFIAQHKGSFVAEVINLRMDKLLKDVPTASNGRPDSIAVFKYYKKHFWDGVDFQNDAIVRTPFFVPKLKYYLDNIVIKHPDSTMVEVDRLIDKTKPGSLFNKLMIAHMTYTYETSKIMGFDKVFVHIIDRYFKTGKAKGIYDDESVVGKIIKRADKLRPLLVDAVAPELYMIPAADRDKFAKMGFESAKTSEEVTKLFYANQTEITKSFQTLHSVKADYTILVFWDVDCSHCKVEIPKLLTAYHELQKENIDVKVFAVYTQHEGEKYLKYLADNKLDWINVYDAAHYNNVADKYDIYSTPVIYLLDKNKVIKAKQIGAEQVKDILHSVMDEEKHKK